MKTRSFEFDAALRDTLNSVYSEMKRQDAKFGAERDHTAPVWMSILTEEVGEAAEDANDITFSDAESGDMETELIQVAAVAIQAATALRVKRLKQPL